MNSSPRPAWADSPLGQSLLEDACSFDFFQAVALLQRLRDELKSVGGLSDPRVESLRFRVNQRLAFPASQIQKLELDGRAAPLMSVNFMGLTGPMGVLPYVYTELILERARVKDETLADFFDIFNHRIISFFYRAWQKPRFPVSYGLVGDSPLDNPPVGNSKNGGQAFTGYLLDLIGLGTTGLRGRQDVPDEALLHYLSLIAMQSRSSAALEQIVADYFGVPVEIQQFTGGWYQLDSTTQCEMTEEDSASHQLGGGAVVGDAIWDRQVRVRIRLGPLTMERYCDFLPGQSGYIALRAITRFFTNDCLEFELQLVLARSHVPGIRIDAESPEAARLGWVSWAKTAPMAVDPEDTILTL